MQRQIVQARVTLSLELAGAKARAFFMSFSGGIRAQQARRVSCLHAGRNPETFGIEQQIEQQCIENKASIKLCEQCQGYCRVPGSS